MKSKAFILVDTIQMSGKIFGKNVTYLTYNMEKKNH